MEQDENILVLTDDKDQDVPFEILEEMTLDGAHSMVLAPLMEEEQADEDDSDLLIFRVDEINGEEAFQPVEDPALLQRVMDVYIVDEEGNNYAESDFVPAE